MNADEKGRGSQDVNRSSVNTTRHVHVTFEHLTNPRNLDRARRTARRTHNHFAGPTLSEFFYWGPTQSDGMAGPTQSDAAPKGGPT